jgi:hypothetical protein
MPKRNLRIVKRESIAIGVCERCNSQFKSTELSKDDARADVRAQFDAHDCKPLDESQNATRIVREATENH